jgi:hypothetical protein
MNSLDRDSFHYVHPVFGAQKKSRSSEPESSDLGLFPPLRPELDRGYRIPKKENMALTSSDIKYFDRPLPSLPESTPAGPGWRFHAAFGCLCIVNLVCALDATSLAVAIPVRQLLTLLHCTPLTPSRLLQRSSMAMPLKLVGGEQVSSSLLLSFNLHSLVST